MRDPHAPRTGVLECEKGSASFYVDDFCFSIMNNVMKKITNRFGETYNAANFLFTLKKQGNFLIGATNDGNSIAIYAKDCLDNYPTSKCIFRTSTYVIQDSVCAENFGYCFDAIELRGGILSSLFSDRLIDISYSNNNYIIKNDTYELTEKSLLGNQSVTIKIGWFTCEHSQSRKSEISTNNPYFRFEFDTPINLDDALLHIEKARELMSFLSFRDNVEFGNITLQRKHHSDNSGIPQCTYYSTDATVFINYGFEPTQKESRHCICIDEIGDPVFKLFSMFYDTTDYNPIAHLDFIPKTDKESGSLAPIDIREIATFLECEEMRVIEILDNKSKKLYDKTQRLSNLLKKIEQVIQKDEDENGVLPDSIHSQLTKRFQDLSLPSKNRDVLLFESYQDITMGVTRYSSDREIINSSDVKNFRDYRNKETHGDYNLLDLDIVITAFHLIATVYCSILHRAGVNDQTLKNICDKSFIL